ncbi:MAG: ACT domain-containing protein, partial [Clostridium sp.]
MIMLVDISNSTVSFEELVDRMNKLGQTQNLKIHVMHEDIFNSMHRI